MLEDEKEKDDMGLVIAETVEVLPPVPGRDAPEECISMAGGVVDASRNGGAGHDTLADILYARAALDPDRDGFIFLNYGSGEKAKERLNYANLLARAKAVAAALHARAKRGDRVLILCPPGLDYIVAFFGTILAGMVAVPAYPPRNAKHMERLRAIVADAKAAAVLAPEAFNDRLTDWAGGSDALPPLVAADRFTGEAGAAFRDAGVKPDDLAFLQYTSGTTGTPKGVMVSHAQVVANLERICDLIAPRRTDTCCCWLPPYHDMGLIGGILFPVMAGLPIVLMAPAAFLQRPLRWLEAMSDYRAAITTAPNFAWQVCADAVDEETPGRLDLTALRCALSGAEKVRYETMEAFARKFAPYGFRRESIIPVYGMAETVLLATGTPPRTPAAALLLDPVALCAGRVNILERRVAGEARSVLSGDGPAATTGHLAVSCGRVIAGHDLRIVDPETRAECAGDAIGEIWLSGPSLATGYWGRSAETSATFNARPSGVSDGPCYLRTGDLGTVIDRDLYVLGRLKEMIIVRGRNHYAQDLEETAASADPLLGHDRTIAFAIEGRSEEQLVLVHELTRSALRAFEAPAVAAAMRKAVVEVHEIAVAAIVFVKPASLPRTTSGKLQRDKARQLFRAGELAEVARWERPAAGEASTGVVEPPRAASSPAREANRLGGAPARILRHVDPAIAAATSRARADRMIAWLRAYAEDHINSKLIDERRTIPPYIVLDFARQGLMGPQIGLEHGGSALTFDDTLRLIEQLAAIDLSLALFVGLNHVLGTEPIRLGGSAALRDRILPEIASGSSVAAFAVTEPGAGSNPRGMQAVAIPDGPGRWKLFGEKWWSGNASWANYICVFCKLQDEKGRVTGTAGFLVERGMPGLRQGPEALTMGMRGMVQNSIFLEGVSVDRDRMLGEEGDGLSLALACMRLGRLGIAAMCLGGMARSAQLMTRYAGRRVVGSGNLLDNPVTRERISRIVSERLALACLVEHVGGRIDAGAPVAEDLFHAAKVAAPEFLWQAVDDLVQMFGGRGYIETNGAPQLLRDARVLRVFEGPTETVASYLGFRVLSDEGDLIAALRQIRPEDDGALPALIALREEVRTRIDILSATNRSDLFLPMGEAATFALLTVLLDRAIGDIEATAEIALREALARARLHMWARFEGARRKVSIRGPEAESIDRAVLTELVFGLSARIGDVEQNLPGEAHDLDPLLRRDWDREAPDKAAIARQKGVPPQPAKRPARRVAEDATIVDTIRSHVAAVVGAPLDAVEVDMDLTSLGIDSLAGVQLILRLNRSFNVSLDARGLYDYPTIRALASMLSADDDMVAEDCTPVAPAIGTSLRGGFDEPIATAADILEDAQSADDMRPSDRRTSAGDFLVTGATGMLGTRVVQELLRRTSGKVYCLVRDRNERLFSALRNLGITSWFGDRLIAVSSDLSRGHFNLDDDCYRALAATIGTVVHCAADVDFVKPYRNLRAVNVEAVRAILEFAATGAAKRVIHVSSSGVLEVPEKRGRSLGESEPLANPVTLANGYAQSKWAAEAMMMGAHKRGFEVIICRAPWLLDPLDVTQGRADGFIRSFIAGCLQMGHAPDSAMSLNLMPVDFVGKAIAVLASSGATLEAVYHLGAERMLAIWELARLIRTPAYEVALEPFEAWTDRVERRLAGDEDFALKRYAPLFCRRDCGSSIITAYLRGDIPSMNSRNTHESLQAMGLTEIPSLDAMCGLIRSIAAAVRGDQTATVVS